jgi:hypothetical protein
MDKTESKNARMARVLAAELIRILEDERIDSNIRMEHLHRILPIMQHEREMAQRSPGLEWG